MNLRKKPNVFQGEDFSLSPSSFATSLSPQLSLPKVHTIHLDLSDLIMVHLSPTNNQRNVVKLTHGENLLLLVFDQAVSSGAVYYARLVRIHTWANKECPGLDLDGLVRR
jgi:hypothetical protein